MCKDITVQLPFSLFARSKATDTGTTEPSRTSQTRPRSAVSYKALNQYSQASSRSVVCQKTSDVVLSFSVPGVWRKKQMTTSHLRGGSHSNCSHFFSYTQAGMVFRMGSVAEQDARSICQSEYMRYSVVSAFSRAGWGGMHAEKPHSPPLPPTQPPQITTTTPTIHHHLHQKFQLKH